MDILDQIEAEQIRKQAPTLRPGETVRVHVKVVEGEKERTQVFEGIVIRIAGKGNRTTFTVRKISYGVGVERIFPLYSPLGIPVLISTAATPPADGNVKCSGTKGVPAVDL